MNATRTYLAALALVAGCGLDDGPAMPTWATDVKPILDANCVRCHGYPSIGGAPATFRLDMYDDFVPVGGGDTVSGVYGSSPLISGVVSTGQMPPPEATGQGLTDRQVGIIVRWFQDNDAARGTAPAGNRAPAFELTRALDDSLEGTDLVLQYQVRDADHDLVTGQVIARPASGGDDVIAGYVHSGRGEMVWDTTGITESHELILTLDDGDLHESSLGSFTP